MDETLVRPPLAPMNGNVQPMDEDMDMIQLINGAFATVDQSMEGMNLK
jgi:hypothetical protein